MTIRIKNGTLAHLFLVLTVLTMALQLFPISKNGATKNPAEYFQRDVRNKKLITVSYNG
jgi:hypothetical protein